MKRICRNCEYWDTEHKCGCPKFVFTGGGAKAERDGFGYWDYEGYGAYYAPGPEFGCVHWKQQRTRESIC